MSALTVTQLGRVAAENLMVDTCTITRVTGQTTDTQTAAVTPTTATIYAGKCRVQDKSRLSRPTTVAEAYVFQATFELQMPITAVGIEINDVVTINTSALDPELAGRKFWVREMSHKTHLTARRVGIEEVAG